MRYPIVFYSDGEFNIILGSKNRKISRGILCSNEEIFLLNKWINLINSNKEKWYVFDSNGILYKIKHVCRVKYKFHFGNLLSLNSTYYVKFEFKKIQELEFSEFKERILKMLKTSAHKWKKAGHDSQTDGFLIGKIIRAETIEEIIRILQ